MGVVIKPMQPEQEWHDLPGHEATESWFLPATGAMYSQAAQMHGVTSKGVLIPDELHAMRLQRAASMISAFTNPGSVVLDVGSGYGALEDIAPKDRTYVGMEPDKHLREASRKRHPGMFVYECGLPHPLKLTPTFDYAVCLGLATHLKPGLDALKWFAAQLQEYASKGLIVEFQGDDYKGQFTKHSIAEITAAFGQKPKGDNVLKDALDSTITVYLRMG